MAASAPARADTFAEFLEWSGAAQALSGLVAAVRALPGFPLETRMRVERARRGEGDGLDGDADPRRGHPAASASRCPRAGVWSTSPPEHREATP